MVFPTVFQETSKGIFKFQSSFKEISRDFKNVSSEFQGGVNSVSMELEVSFKGVSSVFHRIA